MPRTKHKLDMARGAYLGTTLGATLMLFAYAGYRIDLWLLSSPIGLIVGCLLGLGCGMTYVIRKVSELQSEAHDTEGKPPPVAKHDDPR